MVGSVSCDGMVPLVLKSAATSARFRHFFSPLGLEHPTSGLETGFQEIRHVRGPSPISQRPSRCRLTYCLAPRIIGDRAIFFMRSSSLSWAIYSPQSPLRGLSHHAVDSPFTSFCNEFLGPCTFFVRNDRQCLLQRGGAVGFENWGYLSEISPPFSPSPLRASDYRTQDRLPRNAPRAWTLSYQPAPTPVSASLLPCSAHYR